MGGGGTGVGVGQRIQEGPYKALSTGMMCGPVSRGYWRDSDCAVQHAKLAIIRTPAF